MHYRVTAWQLGWYQRDAIVARMSEPSGVVPGGSFYFCSICSFPNRLPFLASRFSRCARLPPVEIACHSTLVVECSVWAGVTQNWSQSNSKTRAIILRPAHISRTNVTRSQTSQTRPLASFTRVSIPPRSTNSPEASSVCLSIRESLVGPPRIQRLPLNNSCISPGSGHSRT